jgi:hypothetical protein
MSAGSEIESIHRNHGATSFGQLDVYPRHKISITPLKSVVLIIAIKIMTLDTECLYAEYRCTECRGALLWVTE